MISSCENMASRDCLRPVEGSLLDAWFELNYRLQEEAVDTQINRAFVEQWLIRLWTIVCPAPPCFWLFPARINERKEFRSRLCLFDLKTFNELGRALHLFMHTGNVDDRYVGKYLRG